MSWRFHVDDIAFIVGDCGAKVLFVTRKQAAMLPTLRARLPDLVVVAVGDTIEGCLDYEAAIAAEPAGPIADEARGSDMLYSSGSTGRPKGVMQMLPSIGIDGLTPMYQAFAARYGWGPTTTYIMPAPLYHSGPLRFSMAMQYVGATLVVMERFDAREALALCERYKVTHGHFVPTMMVRILKLPPEERLGFDLSAMRIVMHGAAPCPPEVKRAMIEWLGPILEESYGGTEGNGMTMIGSREWLEHPGSVGKPYTGAIHIVGLNGEDLPPGEIGLVYFAGGPKFEYHGNPEKTREAHDDQGRSTLGDIGYLDADGYLYLTDRKHDLIITGAINVYPQEIENLLIAHPKVLDVAVFGLPDTEMGEVIQAVVQLKDPDEADEDTAAELMTFCRSRLPSYKVPRAIDFRRELPRHDTGKVYKGQLKREYLKPAAGTG